MRGGIELQNRWFYVQLVEEGKQEEEDREKGREGRGEENRHAARRGDVDSLGAPVALVAHGTGAAGEGVQHTLVVGNVAVGGVYRRVSAGICGRAQVRLP